MDRLTLVMKASLLQAVCWKVTSNTGTIQYKLVTSLAANSNALAYYKQSHGYARISHTISNIHGLFGWSCNNHGIISEHTSTLNLLGCFSHKWPGYEGKLRNTWICEHVMYIVPSSTRYPSLNKQNATCQPHHWLFASQPHSWYLMLLSNFLPAM